MKKLMDVFLGCYLILITQIAYGFGEKPSLDFNRKLGNQNQAPTTGNTTTEGPTPNIRAKFYRMFGVTKEKIISAQTVLLR